MGVMVKPHRPVAALSRTANARETQLVSPGKRPMILIRRRVSPKVRSMKLECLIRLWCRAGNRRYEVSELRSVRSDLTAAE